MVVFAKGEGFTLRSLCVHERLHHDHCSSLPETTSSSEVVRFCTCMTDAMTAPKKKQWVWCFCHGTRRAPEVEEVARRSRAVPQTEVVHAQQGPTH